MSITFCKVIFKGPKSIVPILSSVRHISSKHKADISRPPPFPYETRNFSFPWYSLEDTEDRFNQNSKIIVVEGTIASGKTAFCEKLADELDMLFLPPANMDMLYKIGDFDIRSLDDKFSSENLKSYDEKSFCETPNHVNSMQFQLRMLQLRFSIYVDALAHMMSTGQGVVLQRSPYSDFVFVEAMDKCGYISKKAKDVYHEVLKFTMPTLLLPHLFIYLDTPAAKAIENIKKRNNCWEVNSPLFKNEKYLNVIEDTYKNKFLPSISDKCELLVYDWSEGGDPEVVVEDIERIDFDNYEPFDKKLLHWRELTTDEWNQHRKEYADEKHDLIQNFSTVTRYDCPELLISGEESLEQQEVYDSVPELYYGRGYNPEKDNLWFKFRNKKTRQISIY